MTKRCLDRFRLRAGRAMLWFVGLAYEEEMHNRGVGESRTSLQRDCERLFAWHVSHNARGKSDGRR